MATQQRFLPLSDEEERIGKAVVNAAYNVHKELGPGLLEKVYETCLCKVFRNQGFIVHRQMEVPIVLHEEELDEKLVLDMLVNDLVICEVKAVDKVNALWKAQVISHLKLRGNRLGYVINFNVPLIKDGIT
jgi:GxxExxY protein